MDTNRLIRTPDAKPQSALSLGEEGATDEALAGARTDMRDGR